jgi:hypothetical protein
LKSTTRDTRPGLNRIRQSCGGADVDAAKCKSIEAESGHDSLEIRDPCVKSQIIGGAIGFAHPT